MTVTDELSALSERELEVLKLVATGATNQQIARELVISPNTVKVHLRNIFEKLGVQSRTEATMEAVRRGWVTVGGADAPAEAEEVAAIRAEEAVAEPKTERAAPLLPPISLPELMPHAPQRRPAARWQHALLFVALAITLAATLLPSWLESRSAAASLNAFSDAGRPQVESPARIAAQRWSAGAPLPTPRNRLALATDGTRLYAIGGETADGVTGDAHVYDPATNGWLPAPRKPTPVANAGAAAIGGRIYVAGGSTARGGVSNVLEIYEPATGKWTTGPELPRPLAAYAVTAWNGKLYLFGGWDGATYRAETLIFDPVSGAWTEGPPLPSPRAFAAATVLKDVIYVLGGMDGRAALRDMLAYEPNAAADGKAWIAKAPLARPRAGLAAVGAGTQIFALGGGQVGEEAFNEQFDTRVGAWSRLGTPMAGEWRNLGAATINNKLYAVGGWSGGYLDTHEQYRALIIQLIPSITG